MHSYCRETVDVLSCSGSWSLVPQPGTGVRLDLPVPWFPPPAHPAVWSGYGLPIAIQRHVYLMPILAPAPRVSNPGWPASDLGVGSVMGGMRNTPSSSFLRSSFGQLTDLQVCWTRMCPWWPGRAGGGGAGGGSLSLDAFHTLPLALLDRSAEGGNLTLTLTLCRVGQEREMTGVDSLLDTILPPTNTRCCSLVVCRVCAADVSFPVKVESMHQLQQQHVLGGGQSLGAGGTDCTARYSLVLKFL